MTDLHPDGFSLRKLIWVYEELGKDWAVLEQLRNQFQERLDAAEVTKWPLAKWAGTDSLLGALMMNLEHIERRREYYGDFISRVTSGEIHNTDNGPLEEAPPAHTVRPVLSLVAGDDQ